MFLKEKPPKFPLFPFLVTGGTLGIFNVLLRDCILYRGVEML